MAALRDGFVDTDCVAGFITGWAIDFSRPLQGQHVEIVNETNYILAEGLAANYHSGLIDNGVGTGWHGFSLRVHDVEVLSRNPLVRLRFSNGLFESNVVQIEIFRAASTDNCTSHADFISQDPFIIDHVNQLCGCDRVLRDYVHNYGISRFVKVAYAYVLGRPGDPGGLKLYTSLIKDAQLSPLGLIYALAQSSEFLQSRRSLASPPSLLFPFRGKQDRSIERS